MKSWFITGASRGLGRAFLDAALARGDRVAGVARDVGALKPVSDNYGDSMLALELDVTDRDEVIQAVGEAHAALGGLDVVVNNAGLGIIGAVEEASEDEARSIFETNVFGALWVTQAALPYLREQGSGHIVQVSSVGGVVAFPMVGFYNATKFALEGLSDSLAQEVAQFGIDVTLIEPGPMRTDWPSASMHAVAEPLAAYEASRERRLEAMADEYAGRQPGDPTRAAGALLEIVDNPEPPLRLLMGNGAFEAATTASEARLEEWVAWEQRSRTTDFPADV